MRNQIDADEPYVHSFLHHTDVKYDIQYIQASVPHNEMRHTCIETVRNGLIEKFFICICIAQVEESSATAVSATKRTREVREGRMAQLINFSRKNQNGKNMKQLYMYVHRLRMREGRFVGHF